MKGKYQISLVVLLLCIGVRAQTLDVLTYNIKYDNPKDSLNNWDHRKDFLISQLNFYEPEVFGTQEGLLHQLMDIKKGMDGYEYFGKGRDDGDKVGEFSAIFYNREKLELLENNTFWLSQTSEKPSKGWDAAIKRVCTYGLFQSKKKNKKFWVFNTHFDHVGEQAREESIKLILEKIKKINTANLPLILMGDLNLEPDHPSIRFLSTKMDDNYTHAGDRLFGPNGTFNGFNFFEPVTRRIDYIFTSKDSFDVVKHAILSDSKDCRYPSDHFPVLSRLKFKNE